MVIAKYMPTLKCLAVYDTVDPVSISVSLKNVSFKGPERD